MKRLLALPFRYRPWRPYCLQLIGADLVGTARQAALDDRTHLEAAIDWLCRAQDIREGQSDQGGVSAGWSFEDNWLPSYPETSGYIVETFVAAEEVLSRPELRSRANRIIDWELSIQNTDGSFPGHFGEAGSKPVIFNTGQILHGIVAGATRLDRPECAEAAVKAGHWMVQQQDEDGCWRRSVHNDVPHTYNTRAAWALLRAGLLADEPAFVDAVKKNMSWALSQQNEKGWYATNAFVPNVAPFTHTIAYAIRGILECGLLLQDEALIDSATRAARAMSDAQRADGWLAGTYDENWQPKASYCCLTGVAQMSLIWLRINQHTKSPWAADSAARGIQYLKRNQRLSGDHQPHDGAIAGSAPIWGGYSRFEFPNWATKFYADALMMQMADIAIP